MKEENEKQEVKSTPKNTQNNIYSEDNLITGTTEEQSLREFEDWFKVKIQGTVKSYKIHDDGSLQLKFQEVIEKTISGTTYNDYEDKSIRIRKPNNKPFLQKEIPDIVGKNVEIIDVTETPQYKKIAEGEYDFNKIENYFYSANNLKVIDKSVSNGYQLFKIFELNVMDVIPSISFDKRKRTQIIEKDKSVLVYQIGNDTLITTHKITVDGLNLTNALQLKGKDIVVLDLVIKGKNHICSKIKLK